MASSGLTAEGRAKLILDMASDHMSVDDEVREKALDSLAKAVKDTPEITLVDIFKQESLGSATDLKYLNICHQYLDIRLEDEAFARLAAANGMVGESTLSAALERQKSSFENYQIIMPLVEILDETHGMSTADSTAVLLTQNRIKSNGLAEALNALGRTAKEKEAVNRRFGAFVIKQGLATLDEVNTALEKQRSHWQAGSSFPFISDILKETETLPESDILQLLEEQRQFEKRRLDLEKALYTPKTELSISKQLSKIFVLIISPDGTEAVIKRREEADRDMPVYHLLIWLKRAGITAGIVEDVTLAAFIRESKVKDSLIVARGYPPQPGIDQRIAFYFDRPVTETEQETSPPQIFPKGSLIARIVPGIPGKPGKDVTGRPIPAPKPKRTTINAGTGIIRKGNEFFAARQGPPELSDDGGTLLIPPEIPREQTKRITTTIREDTGDRYASVDVDLKADIGQEGVLRCNNLVVHGNIEGQALCSGTLEVRGAIGRNPSSEKENVGHRTELFSRGQMTVSKDICTARLISGDRLTAVNATIVAAEIIAHKGITI
ncbi:MAG: FapA family protein, partial [Desulfobacterales bacterium]|nr:FapA family protein [Desulfobacterales bacterium]